MKLVRLANPVVLFNPLSLSFFTLAECLLVSRPHPLRTFSNIFRNYALQSLIDSYDNMSSSLKPIAPMQVDRDTAASELVPHHCILLDTAAFDLPDAWRPDIVRRCSMHHALQTN